MSFDSQELSLYLGAPVELFLFRDDTASNTWAFTTGDEKLIDGLVTYQPDVIRRSSVRQSVAESQGAITINLPADSKLVSEFKAYLPARPISLRIFRYHVTDAGAEKRVVFIGEVVSATFNSSDGSVTLNCQPVLKAFRRKVPWQVFKANCNWALYELGCGVLRDLFATDPAGSFTVSGATITSSAFSTKPDGWFTNGYVELVSTGERRFITSHIGSNIDLIYPFAGLTAATPIKVYAGCDRYRGTCKTKFNNLPNQLAFDWIPTENPFESPVDGARTGSSSSASTADVLAAIKG